MKEKLTVFWYALVAILHWITAMAWLLTGSQLGIIWVCTAIIWTFLTVFEIFINSVVNQNMEKEKNELP
jgi:hypothetical protein